MKTEAQIRADERKRMERWKSRALIRKTDGALILEMWNPHHQSDEIHLEREAALKLKEFLNNSEILKG